MNITVFAIGLTTALALGSLLVAAFCLRLLGRAREEAQNCAALATGLDAELTETARDLDLLSRVSAEQTRRLCALEERERAAAAAEAWAVSDEPPAPPTITERRHRVMQLARRGADAGEIASILNMPTGEVELMVGLGRAY